MLLVKRAPCQVVVRIGAFSAVIAPCSSSTSYYRLLTPTRGLIKRRTLTTVNHDGVTVAPSDNTRGELGGMKGRLFICDGELFI